MEVFGVSGSITKASGICTLPINVVNEKIYLVLWLTFVLASLLSLVQVLHQALLVAPSLRPYMYCPSPVPLSFGFSPGDWPAFDAYIVVNDYSVLMPNNSGNQADETRLLWQHGRTSYSFFNG